VQVTGRGLSSRRNGIEGMTTPKRQSRSALFFAGSHFAPEVSQLLALEVRFVVQNDIQQ
jgi:hypothetical protein